MPKTRRPEPIYRRGKYRLDRRPDREALVISWYDPETKRERNVSTGTGDDIASRAILDRMFLKDQGETLCPTCGQVVKSNGSPPVVRAISDYLVSVAEAASFTAIRPRLNHVLRYIEARGLEENLCSMVDEKWVAGFREWMTGTPIVTPSGREKPRALSTVENSVLQLAAAIRMADKSRSPKFATKQPAEVNRTVTYRADMDMLVKMFEYATEPKKRRESLLAFLRFSVLTLARPDAVFDASVAKDRRQWDAQNETFNLNPVNRPQTTKHRPIVPIAKQGVAWLNTLDGVVVEANSIKSAWSRMAAEIGLPLGDGDGGPKLIRRSMPVLLRKHMFKQHWPEIELFMGHNTFNKTTRIYAPIGAEHLDECKLAIERLIREIEKRVPGAFLPQLYRVAAPEGVEYVS